MRGASRTAPRQETRPTTFAPISVYSRLFFDQLVATGISDLTRPCQVSGFARALHVYVAPSPRAPLPGLPRGTPRDIQGYVAKAPFSHDRFRFDSLERWQPGAL